MNHYLCNGITSKQNSLYHFIFKPCLLLVVLHTDFQEQFISTNLSSQRFKITVFYLNLSEEEELQEPTCSGSRLLDVFTLIMQKRSPTRQAKSKQLVLFFHFLYVLGF